MESINEIKSKLKLASENELIMMLNEYRNDERVGVKNLVKSFDKKLKDLEKERDRIESMKEYEYMYSACTYICGIDEVGRGPLAGPIVAGAVVFPSDVDILYLNDSKKLSEKKREQLFDEIYEKAITVGIGMANHKIIDEINILQADYVAMRQAISKLNVRPDLLLNDAVHISDIDIPQISIIKGDTKSISIAAASIVAKVTRDRLMDDFDKIYPQYDFKNNKGYGTKTHIEAIKKYGLCPIHRKTFVKNII